MWAGHSAYFEIADGAVVDFGGATAQVDDGHGWIAVDEIRTSDQPIPSTRRAIKGPIDRTPRPSTSTAAIAALRAVRPDPGRSAGGGRSRSRLRLIARFRSRCSHRLRPKERE